jgi:hypothetical protein
LRAAAAPHHTPNPAPRAPPHPTAPTCPPESDVKITCAKPNCVKAGTVVPLEGLCNSTVPSGTLKYYVDGVEKKKLTCPGVGEYRKLSVVQENINGIPCCSYRERPARRGGGVAC